MQRLTSIVRLIIIASMLGSCVSCVTFTASRMTLEVGAPRDVSKLNEIQEGVTDLRDILEWFGPPDLIIDGTQEIFDQQSGFQSSAQLPTRTLTAHEGTVVLLYTLNLRWEDSSVKVGHPIITVDERQLGARANELMIILRKRDHKVLNAFTGGPSHERS